MRQVQSDEGLLALLHPFWQYLIGICVLIALGAAAIRLVRRGPSGMGRAVLAMGIVVVVLWIIGVVIAAWSGSR